MKFAFRWLPCKFATNEVFESTFYILLVILGISSVNYAYSLTLMQNEILAKIFLVFLLMELSVIKIVSSSVFSIRQISNLKMFAY